VASEAARRQGWTVELGDVAFGSTTSIASRATGKLVSLAERVEALSNTLDQPLGHLCSRAVSEKAARARPARNGTSPEGIANAGRHQGSARACSRSRRKSYSSASQQDASLCGSRPCV